MAELPKTFTFDNVFDWTSTQGQVYEETARPIVDSVLEGYNGTVFAYGQTGTGKTHTMDGGAGDTGIIPRTFQQIFEAIQVTACLMHFTVRHCIHVHIVAKESKDLSCFAVHHHGVTNCSHPHEVYAYLLSDKLCDG